VGSKVKRPRDSDGNVTQLDLTSAQAEDRRFEVTPEDASKSGTRFFGFKWKKTAAEEADVQVFFVDEGTNTEYLQEERLNSSEQDGNWRPPEEDVYGSVAKQPTRGDASFTWRIQFGQTASACNVDLIAEFKEV